MQSNTPIKPRRTAPAIAGQTPTIAMESSTEVCAATDDIVQDMLALVMSLAPNLTQALADQVDAQLRERWGGDRPYIARRRGEGRSNRNAEIRRDYLAGERLGLLERRYGLSERQLLRIIKSTAQA